MEQSSVLEQLRSLDERALAEVVRQDQGCPDFVLTAWQVERLSDKGIVNPDGLFRFSGMGHDPALAEEERAWSIVLKILRAPEKDDDITSIWYWKRELLAVQSGLLKDLPTGGVKAPRFYRTVEKGESAWIWMEYVREIDPPRWPLERFPETAQRLGKLNGAYLGGRPLPGYPWLSRGQGILWAMDANPDEIQDHPILNLLFPGESRRLLLRLWSEHERFFRVCDELPQVFAHGDTTRRNQLYRMNDSGMQELVSIDWAWCGIAPLGWDLSLLLIDSALLFDLDVNNLAGVEETAFPAYMEGLRAAGWRGDSRLARLGYCVSATLFPLFPGPRVSIAWSGVESQSFFLQTFGRSFDEAAKGWRMLFNHLLNLGEEALALMDELELGRAGTNGYS